MLRVGRPCFLGGGGRVGLWLPWSSLTVREPTTPIPIKWGNSDQIIRKILVSVKFLSAILGPEMAASILWTPGKMRSFCRKNLHVHKFLVFLGGGWYFGFWGGGECRFYFYGRADFSEVFLPRWIWTARIQKYCKSVEKRKLRPWSEFPPQRNSDHGPSWLRKWWWGWFLGWQLLFFLMENKKPIKEKSHKGIWWWECPGSFPGINSGRPRDTRDAWADLCGNSHSRGRMSAGQTGQMTGQMGHVHGTDGCPAKILHVFFFLSFPIFGAPTPGLFLSQILAQAQKSTVGGSPGPEIAHLFANIGSFCYSLALISY